MGIAVSPAALMDQIAAGTAPVVLDVRSRGVRRWPCAGRDSSAVLASPGARWRAFADVREKPIVVYCGHGPRARNCRCGAEGAGIHAGDVSEGSHESMERDGAAAPAEGWREMSARFQLLIAGLALLRADGADSRPAGRGAHGGRRGRRRQGTGRCGEVPPDRVWPAAAIRIPGLPRRTSLWKKPVPGRGNSSPIVWGDRIFLTTAYDGGRRVSLLAFRRSDGAQLWEAFAPDGRAGRAHTRTAMRRPRRPPTATLVYASFGSRGLAAFDFNGKLVWHQDLGDVDNYHGSAGSPLLYKNRVIALSGFRRRLVRRRVRHAHRQSRCGEPRDGAYVGWGTPVAVRVGDQRRDHREQPGSSDGLRSGHGTRAMGLRRQLLRGDSDAGRRPRPGVCGVRPRRADAGDSPRRPRQRDAHASRVDEPERLAVRAVADRSTATSSTR